ncbi:hypothetical protein [Cyanobium usitatum]|uniref:hypothetical protein n=1 Tax=Cyanobium usitatum TaxID=2304190 RepID=UPI002AD2DF02|nr:hypothetical protein [Cyanobium usitatum]
MLLTLWSGSTFAAEQNQCSTLKDERDSLASQAMVAEIDLGRKYREQICPGLARQAEQANANEGSSGIINYEALIDCRKKAEARLKKNNKLLYRNLLGFTFYTPKGASLARQADQKSTEMGNIRCP